MPRIFAASIPLLLLLWSCQPQPPARPNVLLLYVDDLNDRLGCYGDSLVHSPHIDRLAESGTRFTNAYCQFPLCAPSRASMLTGIRPSALGVTRLSDTFLGRKPEITTLPRYFREQGYFTARAGKVFHMGVPDAMARCGSGADDPLAWDEAVNCYGFELNSNGAFYNATPWETHRAGTGGAVSWLRAEKGDDFQHDYNVATQLIQWLEEERAQPFFLAAGFIRPHVPLVAPKRFFERYDSLAIPLPAAPADDRADIPEMALQAFGADFGLSPQQRRDAIRAYYACVSFVDEQVGRVLKALEESGQADNTIVLLVSDHGYQLGEHGLWFKNQLFRESALSPLIVRHPGMPESHGRQVRQPVELLDVFPSLAEWTGLSVPAQCAGESLSPLLEGEARRKDHAIVEVRRGDAMGRALYTRHWSYMRWDKGRSGEELYDLRSDPRQYHNLAGAPVWQDTLQQLRQLLLAEIEGAVVTN